MLTVISASNFMNKKKTRLFIAFYKGTLVPNVLMAVISLLFNASFNFFLTSLCTVGFGVSMLFKEFYRKEEYYFYYNAHIKKVDLILFTFLSNIGIVSLILIILSWLNILYR